MVKKIIIFTLLLYFAILLQSSFFIHFKLFGLAPNLVLIFVLLINLMEKPKSSAGLWAGFWGGLLLDVFSQGLIGLYAAIFFASAVVIKIILRRYVWSPLS